MRYNKDMKKLIIALFIIVLSLSIYSLTKTEKCVKGAKDKAGCDKEKNLDDELTSALEDSSIQKDKDSALQAAPEKPKEN